MRLDQLCDVLSLPHVGCVCVVTIVAVVWIAAHVAEQVHLLNALIPSQQVRDVLGHACALLLGELHRDFDAVAVYSHALLEVIANHVVHEPTARPSAVAALQELLVKSQRDTVRLDQLCDVLSLPHVGCVCVVTIVAVVWIAAHVAEQVHLLNALIPSQQVRDVLGHACALLLGELHRDFDAVAVYSHALLEVIANHVVHEPAA